MTDKNLNMLIRLKKIAGTAVDLADERAAFALAQRLADTTGGSVIVRDENGGFLATFHGRAPNLN